ncbi:hypothetical protein LOK49_LG15G02010 [Camellia lanceoleosa]|uniref:Uncharacterized protein n=1 Tax=Camellia lanceoleosa TaxID=1840588 RepID=A0ACC0F5S0_9ERIC|nr:hypothetical protein LOK49_LG15G02010 [Camellia lanceoleosa]
MKIEELDEVESDGRSYNHSDDRVSGRMIVRVDSKRALVGAGLGSCSTRPFCTMFSGTRFKLSSDGGTKLISIFCWGRFHPLRMFRS